MKIQKKIKLPDHLSTTEREEVGDLLVNEIKRYTFDGKSPVAGLGNFKKLNKDYADENHKGDRTPRLRLDGDMFDSLGFKVARNGELTVGIMDASEQDKADGHNNFTGKSELPQRRFVPSDRQTFKRDIMAKVNKIIDRSQPDATETDKAIENLFSTTTTQSSREITITDLIAGGLIDEL